MSQLRQPSHLTRVAAVEPAELRSSAARHAAGAPSNGSHPSAFLPRDMPAVTEVPSAVEALWAQPLRKRRHMGKASTCLLEVGGKRKLRKQCSGKHGQFTPLSITGTLEPMIICVEANRKR
jgi:hypothetical protein